MFLGDAFSLGFSPLNIIISLAFITLAIFFVKRNIHSIEFALEERLKSSLNRLFAGSNKQPLYSVFYNLHHSSTESWVNWIKSQNEKKQERAFRRLSEYLAEPPKELGLITKEVVKATALFRHEDSYEVLENLLRNSREDWGRFKALNIFYEDAALSIVSLDPNKAEIFLIKELNLAKNSKEADELKISIINALSKLPNVDRILDAFAQIILDSNQSPFIRLEVLKRVENMGEQAYYETLKDTFGEVLKNKSEKDKEIYDYCINQILESARIDNGDGTIEDKWNLLIKSCTNEFFGERSLALISERIADRDFLINPKAIFKLLKKDGESNLNLALERRFAISEEEKEIFASSEECKSIQKTNSNTDEVINVEINKNSAKANVPEFLKQEFNQIEETLNQKIQGINKIKLIVGEAVEEKIFFIRTHAAKSNKTLISIDTEKLLLSPGKIDELEEIIQDNKPCIVFLKNITKLIENTGNEAKRAEKLFNKIRKLYIDSRIQIIATIDLDSITIRDDHPELNTKIQNIPNNDFALKINLGALSAKQKQKIFNQYELKLKDEREVCIDGIEDVLNATEGFSNIKYMSFLLNYMRSSLLSHGKLIPLSTYKELQEEENEMELLQS